MVTTCLWLPSSTIRWSVDGGEEGKEGGAGGGWDASPHPDRESLGRGKKEKTKREGRGRDREDEEGGSIYNMNRAVDRRVGGNGSPEGIRRNGRRQPAPTHSNS
eukprot:scaffold68728_cov32-Tisochrysis_lutea.AAC.4